MKKAISLLISILLIVGMSPLAFSASPADFVGAGTQLNGSQSTPTQTPSPKPTATPTPTPTSTPKPIGTNHSSSDWILTITGISTEKNSDIIKDTLTTDDTVYFSVKLSGGKPGAKTKIHCISTYPGGKEYTSVSEKEWESGWTGWFSSKNMTEGGVLLKEFYDDNGNLIGSGSVNITKSSSNSRSGSRTESEAKSIAGDAVKTEVRGRYNFTYDSKKTSYSILSADYKKFENAWIVKGTVTVYYLDGNGSTNGNFEVKIYDWFGGFLGPSGDPAVVVSLDIH